MSAVREGRAAASRSERASSYARRDRAGGILALARRNCGSSPRAELALFLRGLEAWRWAGAPISPTAAESGGSTERSQVRGRAPRPRKWVPFGYRRGGWIVERQLGYAQLPFLSGGAQESNLPGTLLAPHTGFEV